MEKLVKVGISNRHVHLTEEVYNRLFDTPMEKRNDLHQVGEFASNQVVTVKTKNGEIENVRVVGPFREYSQVELSRTDAIRLNINPPVRRSGDLENSETVTLVGNIGSVTLNNSCIIADRHVHMNPKMAHELNVVDKELVKIRITGDKSCILDAHIKISDNGFYEVHLDLDDANAAGVKNNDEVTMIL